MNTQRDNFGSFRKNDRKEKDSHPDVKGKMTVEGKEYWFSAWRKSTDGQTWYSASLTPKDEPKAVDANAKVDELDDLNDEVPF